MVRIHSVGVESTLSSCLEVFLALALMESLVFIAAALATF